ncbi:MAG: hypothetical protein AAF739_14560 [Pseudomonadota bacterium]
METRPPPGALPLAPIPEPKQREGASETELPKVKSVPETDKTEDSGTARDSDAKENERTVAERVAEASPAIVSMSETEVKTHAATGSVVLQTLDMSSGELINQFPNNATLKQRALEKYAALQGTGSIKRTIL